MQFSAKRLRSGARHRRAALIAQADAARDVRDYARAAALYTQALRLSPRDAAIQIQAGHMFKETGQLDRADAHYRTAERLIPDDPDLQLQLGHFYKVAGRVPEAVAAYQLAVALSSDETPRGELAALGAVPCGASREKQLAARAVLFLRDDAARRGSLGTLSARRREVAVRAVRRQADAARDAKDFASAAALYAKVLAQQPANAAIHVQCGHMNKETGRLDAAELHYLIARTLTPNDADLHLQLGHFYKVAGRFSEAATAYRLAARLAPDLAHAAEELFSLLPPLPPASETPSKPALPSHAEIPPRPDLLFDEAFYRSRAGVPDQMDAWAHYCRIGAASRLDPHRLFATGFYLDSHPDVALSGENPLLHFIRLGEQEGRQPHPLFDPTYYLEQALDPEARAAPLRHYLTHGAGRGLSPSRLFDPGWYLNHSAWSWDGRPLPQSGPRISILVPVYNTPPAALQACIESVRHQFYSNWELCLIDDCSTDPATITVLDGYRGVDQRIKVSRSPSNLHIAAATNRAARVATGEFLAFLDHDDALAVHALAEVALAIATEPLTDLLYTDEDKLDFAGQHVEPYRKPDWSPDHLHSVMYLLHMLVIRKALFWRLGGLRPERSGAQDYDLALRASQAARHVHHVPRVLYHWRMVPGSAAATVDAKPYALVAAQEALQEALVASGADATVENGLLQGTFRVRYSLAAEPPVTLLVFTNDGSRVVPGRGNINLVRHFVRSIVERSTYRNYRLLIVDNGNSSPETRRLVEEAGGEILSYEEQEPFNYARKANFATRAVGTDHLIYLNDDLEVIGSGWIEALLELSSQGPIGGVGARLLYPNDTVQHAGMVLGIHGSVAHVFHALPRQVVGYNGYTHVVRNYSAVTGAVFATRMDVMQAVGGLDERLRVDFNDVDLCLRIGRLGKRIVYTPHCELYHFEGSTAVRTMQAPDEVGLFRTRWADVIANDPFYNPGCPRDRLNFV